MKIVVDPNEMISGYTSYERFTFMKQEGLDLNRKVYRKDAMTERHDPKWRASVFYALFIYDGAI